MEQMQPDSRQILNIDLLHSLRVIEARLNGCSCQAEDRAATSGIETSQQESGWTETASLCCNAGQNTLKTPTRASAGFPPRLRRRRATARLLSLSYASVSKTEAITTKRCFVDSSCTQGSRSGRSVHHTVHHKCAMVQMTLRHRACPICFPKRGDAFNALETCYA